MEGKVCTKCKQWKPLEEFNKRKVSKDGRRSECRECQKEYKKQWRGNNPEYDKEYYKDNAEHIKEREKQYRKDNAEHIKEYRKDNAEYFKQWRQDNAEHRKGYGKQWRLNNKENNLQYISSIVEQINPVMKELPVYGYIYINLKT
jgi:hypothetical protein